MDEYLLEQSRLVGLHHSLSPFDGSARTPNLSDLDPRLEEAESYTESYAESYAEPYAASEVQAEKEAEAQAEKETEAQAEKETKGEQVDYTRPRSERIKKRAMMESAGPDSPDSPDPAVPSTKRIKDDDHLVDVLALQQSLYAPLGKTYPYFPTPVPAPPKLPEAAQDWLNQVIQQDRQTGRIRYVHAPLLRPFNQNHLTVLNAAFDAYKDQLEIMRDSNFEFISVLAECSPAQVRAWFSDQAKKQHKEQRKQGRMQKHQKVTQKQIRKRQVQQQERKVKKLGRPRDPEQVRQDKHRIRLENRPPGKQGPKPKAKWILPTDAPALERVKHVSRVRIPEERQVLQTFRCATTVMSKRGIPLAWTQCKGCVARQASDFCAFINFRIFEVVSEEDKENVSKYLADHDFYSDPSPDEPMEFDLNGLTRSDAEYVLAYIGHFGKRQLSEELDMALGKETGSGSSKSSKASKASKLTPNEYFRRPTPIRRLCYKCRGSFVSHAHLCTSCGVELCTHCLTHDNGTMLCHEKMRHAQEQFIVCGRYHASTLRTMLERVDEAVKALPSNLHLLSDKMAVKAAQKSQKLESGAKSGSGSQGASMPAPLRVSKDISQEEFQKHWAKGEVLVFTDLQLKRGSAWSPRDLKKQSETSVTVYDAVERTVTVETMAKLSGRGFMGRRPKATRIVEAWPEKPLEEVAPKLYADLMQTLPVPMYTMPTGAFNLSKYLPSDWLVNGPLVNGPKLYIGEGSTDKNVGSVRLSCEKSDALYACVYAERQEGAIAKDDEAVVWDIFQAEDRKKVERFLRKAQGKKAALPKRCVDPYQDIVPYLKSEVLSRLHKATGVKPIRVALNVGEAIMIPAGCLRQAQYVQNAVTVAVDFVSPERLWATIDWCHEKQQYAFAAPMSKTRRTDVFPAYDVAFYSSVAMAQIG
ncbi:hypothetical protein BGZ59_008317 [Podila verticillata]|nr:hypothetical protein BGZ59_008317 [Podila verticillata]